MDELVELADHDVPAEFVRNMRLADPEVDIDRIVELFDEGYNAADLKAMKESGFLSEDEK